MDLMAVSQDDGPVPLYMHTVCRILREMRLQQQEYGGKFDYNVFKTRLMDSGLTPAQLGPLSQRLEALESFMPAPQVERLSKGKAHKERKSKRGTDWKPKVCTYSALEILGLKALLTNVGRLSYYS